MSKKMIQPLRLAEARLTSSKSSSKQLESASLCLGGWIAGLGLDLPIPTNPHRQVGASLKGPQREALWLPVAPHMVHKAHQNSYVRTLLHIWPTPKNVEAPKPGKRPRQCPWRMRTNRPFGHAGLNGNHHPQVVLVDVSPTSLGPGHSNFTGGAWKLPVCIPLARLEGKTDHQVLLICDLPNKFAS